MNKHESMNQDVLAFLKKGNCADSARMLLNSQKKSWPQLKKGYERLKDIKEKEFSFYDFKIKIHLNPGRIKSSSAKVDPDSVQERKCFLCIENLPEEQEGIIYKSEFIILANPFPIFPEHFTISSLTHSPQEIPKNFLTMLRLAKDLSPYYTVFYNGPKCGASAPDHMHFQACSSDFMPLENELEHLKNKYGETLAIKKNYRVFSIDDGLRKIFLIESGEDPVLGRIFNFICGTLKDHLMTIEEPMMNLLVKYTGTRWLVIIFFREKHRPSFFDQGILWSPAAADLGGIAVFPLEKDFNIISKVQLIKGFTEVILSEEPFSYIKIKIKDM